MFGLTALTVILMLTAGPSMPLNAQASSVPTADIALRATRWLDVASGKLRGPVVILVSGGKISDMVPASEFSENSARLLIDLGDAVVLPGLVDAHVHLQIGGRPEENAAAALHAGFTTVVDLGATSDVALRLRDAIASGSIEGPRILAAGRWVGTKNGVCEFGGIGVAGGPDAFRARVRENIEAGADLTKACVSGWTAEAFSNPEAYEITDDALAAIVDESGRSERMVVAHAISLGSVKAALRAGVRGLAHAAYLDAATAEDLKARSVFLIPTLASLSSADESPSADVLRNSVATAYRAGVRIVFGTDGGVLPHGQNAREFVAIAAAGISPLDAIRAATTNASQAIGLAQSIGALEVGKIADIIAVDGNPLADVEALSRVVFVLHQGRVIRKPNPGN